MASRARSGRSKPPRDLTPATGARTTRLRRPQQRRSSARSKIAHGSCDPPCDHVRAHDAVASTASHPNVRDDRDTPLVRDETAELISLIWVWRETIYFSREDSTEKWDSNRFARRARAWRGKWASAIKSRSGKLSQMFSGNRAGLN